MKKLAMLSVLMMASVCFAGPQVLTLSIEAIPDADPATGTFNVFASVTDDGSNFGLSAFEMVLVPSGDVTLLTLENMSPEAGTYGFWNFRDAVIYENGTGYLSAAQGTIYAGTYSSTKDAKVFKRIGQLAGAGAGAEWDAPVLLASGTYSVGTQGGTISVNKPAGSTGASILKNVTGTGWKGPGNEMAPSSVVPDVVEIPGVPEPATIGLLVLGALGLIRRK